MIDLIFDLLDVAYWIFDRLWFAFWGILFLWGLFHIIIRTPTDKPYVSPWRRESLDFDNMPGEKEEDASHQDK